MDVLEAAVRGVSVEGDLAKLAAVLRDTERTRGYSRALQLLDWDWKRMEANDDVVERTSGRSTPRHPSADTGQDARQEQGSNGTDATPSSPEPVRCVRPPST